MAQKPKRPFSRPSISLSSGDKKIWQDCLVERLSPGDNVLGYGILKVITRMGEEVVLDFASGDRERYKLGCTIHAFTSGNARV